MGQSKKIPTKMDQPVLDCTSFASACTTIGESPVRTQSKSYTRTPQPPSGTTHLRPQNQNRKVRSKFQPVHEKLESNRLAGACRPMKPQVVMTRLMAAPSQPIRPPPRESVSAPFRAKARIIKSANSIQTAGGSRLTADASAVVDGMATALVVTTRETATNTSHVALTCVETSNLIGEEAKPQSALIEANGHFVDEEKVGEKDLVNQAEADVVSVRADERSDEDDYEDDYYDDDDIGPEYLSPSTPDSRKGMVTERGTVDPSVPTSMLAPISVLYNSDAETVRRYHSPIEPAIPIGKAQSRPNIHKKKSGSIKDHTGIVLTENVRLSSKSLLI